MLNFLFFFANVVGGSDELNIKLVGGILFYIWDIYVVVTQYKKRTCWSQLLISIFLMAIRRVVCEAVSDFGVAQHDGWLWFVVHIDGMGVFGLQHITFLAFFKCR